MWTAPDHVRLVFDSSAPLSHTIYGLSKPDRLVIDFKNTRMGASFPRIAGNKLIKKIRGAKRKNGVLRVVVDLAAAAKPRSFPLKPNKRYGHRLVVDLYPRNQKSKKAVRSAADVQQAARDVVIAIDAGHGGEDGGARGPHGTQEKDVVLRIARKLAVLVRKEPGMRPVMIRDGDYYLGLRKRIERARQAKADLFISIHADSFKEDRSVRGASVYTLSHRGASSEFARWLAKRENSADLIGGVELADKDEVLRTVLLDLAQNATMQVSADAAKEVLKSLRQVGKLHKPNVQRAGFVVLKSPDIPSLLVETAFISNPTEERSLRDPRHQARLAKAMMQGIRSYFRRYPPPGTLLAKNASKRHVIHRGETLSGIAQQYRIGLGELRRVNGLRDDRIRIGQVLRIPRS